eukprot:10816603-Alexandrium_andersonii.AAC.1
MDRGGPKLRNRKPANSNPQSANPQSARSFATDALEASLEHAPRNQGPMSGAMHLLLDVRLDL